MTLNQTSLQQAIVSSEIDRPFLVNPQTLETGNRDLRGAITILNNAIERTIEQANQSTADRRQPHYNTITPLSAVEPTPTLRLLLTACRNAAAATRFDGTPATTDEPDANTENRLEPGDRVAIVGDPIWLREDDVPDDLIGAYEEGDDIRGFVDHYEDAGHPGYVVNVDDYGRWWFRTANLEPI